MGEWLTGGNRIELLRVAHEDDPRCAGALRVIHEAAHVLGGDHRGFIDHKDGPAVVHVLGMMTLSGSNLSEGFRTAEDAAKFLHGLVAWGKALDLVTTLSGVVSHSLHHEGFS